MTTDSMFPAPDRTHILEAGDTLFRQGDKVRAIFTVQNGRLKLIRNLANGQTVTLHVARAGESFAEAALFSDIYHCDAIADTTATVAAHDKRKTLALFADDPAAATRFMARLAHHMMGLRTRLELRNIRSAGERVMHLLLLSSSGDGSEVRFDRPLKDVAGEIGLTHEAFYRTLAALEKSGAITRDGRKITIKSSI